MLKDVFRSLVWLLALIGAFSVVRTLCWPTSATLYESDGWLVVLTEDQSGRCVVVDRDGAPIPAFPLETNSDSGAWVERTDATGRGRFISFGHPSSATAWLPTGHQVRWRDMGLALMVRKRP